MKTRLETTGQQMTRNFLFLNGRRAALVVAGLVIGIGLALPQDSLAGRKHRHHTVRQVYVEHGHHAYRRVVVSPSWTQRRVHARPSYLTVPLRIVVRAELNRYRPYHSRRVYYAPHHHYHNVYDFPVYHQRRTVSRPYAYCNGNLYGGLHLSSSRPGFSVAVGW